MRVPAIPSTSRSPEHKDFDTPEMNLQKIESVGVDQSLPGRLPGYGDITIIGTGGTREQFRSIADPVRFRRTFQEQVARQG